MAPRELGGRSELDPSGVLLRFAAMWLADMMGMVLRFRLIGCVVEIRILREAG
jgi:hypothetical protein